MNEQEIESLKSILGKLGPYFSNFSDYQKYLKKHDENKHLLDTNRMNLEEKAFGNLSSQLKEKFGINIKLDELRSIVYDKHDSPKSSSISDDILTKSFDKNEYNETHAILIKKIADRLGIDKNDPEKLEQLTEILEKNGFGNLKKKEYATLPHPNDRMQWMREPEPKSHYFQIEFRPDNKELYKGVDTKYLPEPRYEYHIISLAENNNKHLQSLLTESGFKQPDWAKTSNPTTDNEPIVQARFNGKTNESSKNNIV